MLIGINLLWLVIPLFLLLLILLVPEKPPLEMVQSVDVDDALDNDFITAISIASQTHNDSSFEHYLQIKKALAKHHQQFPSAQTHQLKECEKPQETCP